MLRASLGNRSGRKDEKDDEESKKGGGEKRVEKGDKEGKEERDT